ncbi:hypothetical protein O181_112610 [Austropuccinia psidii MF-1]|uniref:Uncharacterized protein n=1 Tax=Austropuccinia psidii MF-1 TaxID=1389203 RepID=A0A9Q3K0T9_9BASI|nr:hypothetical protein [Austropuccinia psidii MF-1]
MSPVHLRNLGIPWNQPDDRQRLFRTRQSRSTHHSGWQKTEVNHTHSDIHLLIKQEPQTRVLEQYGSSSSAPLNPQVFNPMEHGQPDVKPSFTLDRTWRGLPEDLSQRDTLQRSYGNNQRMESQP